MSEKRKLSSEESDDSRTSRKKANRSRRPEDQPRLQLLSPLPPLIPPLPAQLSPLPPLPLLPESAFDDFSGNRDWQGAIPIQTERHGIILQNVLQNETIDQSNASVVSNSLELKKIAEDLSVIKHKLQSETEARVAEYTHIKETIRRTPNRNTFTRSLGIDANSVMNAGVFFTDELRHFPHEFIKDFEDYFGEMNVIEAHKVFAFKGVILTRTRAQFKETVINVNSYDEIKKRFLSFYWNLKAQKKTMKYFRDNVVFADDINIMAAQMQRWARTLSHRYFSCDEEIEIIDLLIERAPMRYQEMLYHEGQSIDLFIRRLEVMSQIDGDFENEVPFVVVPQPMENE
ncbi:uncharacterized protein LOC135836948 [Planococcus citri]|uniref:uncharacterized protein LOC135836948 n=1 Tax=Planococcus citri TaxID=170843 RepID=UPI0031F9131C